MKMNAEVKNQILLSSPRRLGPVAKEEETALEAASDTRESDLEVVERSRQKWRTAADAGFQIIPDVLFRCQRFLELDATDLVILSNITLHWWYEADLPHPRPSVIAARMQVSTRTVERHIGGMEKKKLITRLPSRLKRGKTVREFDLSGLVLRLKRYAAANLEHRGRGRGV